ncbi:MAG: hypothetical protein U0800_07875 [Isosphaeraceae bacterium]
MPIIESPSEGSPLTQGDILQGVKMFLTDAGPDGESDKHKLSPMNLCLVVSRPCVIAHKPQILVAGVVKYPQEPPKDIETLADVLDFMVGARDGLLAPDVFYLGQMPNMKGRYCARLDWLHTIGLPCEPDTRKAFVAGRRIATLNPDFLRSLHTRLFMSFASLGFDDHSWPSDDDLEWIVRAGRSDIAKLDLEVKSLELQESTRSASGKDLDQKQLKQLTNSRKALEDLHLKIAPYEAEYASRTQATTDRETSGFIEQSTPANPS